MYLLFFANMLFLIGCLANNGQQATTSDLSAIEVKATIYKNLMSKVQDEHGFIHSDDCDSLLFSGLLGASDIPVEITAARNEAGQWFRNPAMNCYPEHSKSTISRDMLIGVLWQAWKTKDADLVQRLWDYGVDHNWVMGEGVISRTLMTPALISTTAQLLCKLGQYCHDVRFAPELWTVTLDFEAHLSVLHIALRGEIYGQLSQGALGHVRLQMERQPNNPLFAAVYHRYTDGNQNKAVALLMNEKWWPSDRLPTNEDRCEPWLIQRDYGQNWQPCAIMKQHSGGDLLFIYENILKD